MSGSPRHSLLFALLIAGTTAFFLFDLCFGSVGIPPRDVIKVLFGGHASKDSWDYIILDFRLPKTLTALLAGMALSVSGLLMQTFFRNPLAGPYVLGLSSGASLGVAFVVMGASLLPAFLSEILLSSYGIAIASCAGSILVLLAVLAVSRKLRDTMSILVVGLMFGSFTTAITGVLSYFSTAEQLQKFTFWSLGSLGNLSWEALTILSVFVIMGLAVALYNVKALDGLLLGENYAKSMGLHLNRTRLLILLSTGLLSGVVTAFAGPIAFVGLAVPHIARLTFRTSSHSILFFATLLLGASTMLVCDALCQFPGSGIQLPVNAITSVLGAPVVVWLLVRKRKMA